MEAGRRPQAWAASRRSAWPDSCAAHRRDLACIGEYVETCWPSRRGAVARTAHPPLARRSRSEAAQVKIRLTCVMTLLPRVRRRFSPDMFAHVVCHPGEVAHAFSELLRHGAVAGQRHSKPPGGRSGMGQGVRASRPPRTSVGMDPRLGAGVARGPLDGLPSPFPRGARRVRGRGASRAAFAGIEPLVLTIPGVSPATGAQIAEVGDEPLPRSAVPRCVRPRGLNSSVSQSRSLDLAAP